MNQLFFTATLLLSLLVSAGSNIPTAIRNFKIISATFDSNHIVHGGEGTLAIDYTAGMIRLDVVRGMFCPASRMRAQVMPMPLSVELPITSVQTDSCGIHHVISIDTRPADGDLQQLNVDDPTDMTCQTFVTVTPQAQYLTSFYDRRNSGVVKNVSKMQLMIISPAK